MRHAHGVVGDSKTTMLVRNRNLDPGPNPELHCQLCDFKAATRSGLSLHMRKKHSIITAKRSHKIERQADQTSILIPTKTEAREAQPEGNSDGIPDSLVAVTSGRFIELCRSVAFEYDLPPRLFAARVAAFVYGTQVR